MATAYFPWPTSFRLQSPQVAVDNLELTKDRTESPRCGTPLVSLRKVGFGLVG